MTCLRYLHLSVLSAFLILIVSRYCAARKIPYGRNTTGGAIVWHTNQATPGEGTNGYGRLRMGDGGLTRFEGALGFDISDQFAGRVANMTDERDGL